MSWNNYNCPSCGTDKTIFADGPEHSEILILGEWCDDKSENLELSYGRPYVAKHGMRSGTTTGTILQQMFRYYRENFNGFRKMYMWHHRPPKITAKKGPEKAEQEKKFIACYDHAKSLVMKEAIGKKAIFLIGPAVTKEFTGYNVSDVCGINVADPDNLNIAFSAPIIVPCYNIGSVFKSPGEVKLAIKKFCKLLEDI